MINFFIIFLCKNFFVIINSVIIFLKSKVKNSQRCYFASEEVFVMLVVIVILLLYLHLLMFFILLFFFSLLLNIISHPSVGYCLGFYTPFYTFSPAHRRVIRDTFICSTILFLPRALRP